MNEQDLFNDSDLYQDSESRNAVAAVFGVIIRMIMAITTGGFFAVYAPSLTSWLVGPQYAPAASAGLGVLSIDIMAWLYSYLRSNHATTETQMKAAAMGTIGNIGLSAAVTAFFFILQTNFIPTADAAGNMTAVGDMVNIGGLIVGSLAMAGNGILWAWYQANGIKERAQLSKNQLRAASLTGRFAIEKENQTLTMARTLENIRGQLPTLTAHAGKVGAANYLQSKFGEIDVDGNGKVTDAEINDWLRKNPQEVERFTDAVREVRQQPARPTPAPQPTPAHSSWHSGYDGRYHLKARDNIDSVSYAADNNLDTLISRSKEMIANGKINDTARIFDTQTGERVWWYMEEAVKEHKEAQQPARPTPAPRQAQSNGHAAGYSYPNRDGYSPE